MRRADSHSSERSQVGIEGGETPVRFGECLVLPQARQLLVEGRPRKLGSRAFDLLTVLIEARGSIVGKDELVKRVWPTTFVDEANLRVHVAAIRKALGADRDCVKTIPGRGYIFASELTVVKPSTAVEAIAERHQTNLPQALKPLIGREIELSELRNEIQQNRLLTLVGAGGIGKTRLAIELGRQMLESFPDGVLLIDLAPLTDQAALASTTATVLGVALRHAERTVETIAASIRRQRKLLIFDSCEPLAIAVASLIEGLLSRAPGLSVLATSQEVLRIPGERVYRVSPLAVPPLGATEIGGYGSVALFVERAHAADRRFILDADNEAGVAEICRRLDGIPLALQMAAARVAVLGIEGLRTGLDERLKMLKSDLNGGALRHRTLLATVEWSHGLLDREDTKVFRRLAVFAGTFTLDAVVAVAGERGADRWEVADALGRLIDKSLVSAEGGRQPRYRLLETLRLYAAEQLVVSGENDEVAARHAQYLTEVFSKAHTEWDTSPAAEWLETYKPELDNLRIALEWAQLKSERAPLACALTAAAGTLWIHLGLALEGRRYVDQAVGLLSDRVPATVAASLLRHSGSLRFSSHRLEALESLERSAALCRELGDPLQLARALNLIGSICTHLGRRAEAKAALEEARDILSSVDQPKTMTNLMFHLGTYHLVADEIVEAGRYFSRGLDLARALDDHSKTNVALLNLAAVEYRGGNLDRAVELTREALVYWHSVGQAERAAEVSITLVSYLISQGSFSEARAVAAETLSMHRDRGGWHCRFSLLQWAVLGALDGCHEGAARLAGFVDASKARSGEVSPPMERELLDRLTTLLRAGLSAPDIELHAAEGVRWSESDAVRYVQNHLIAPDRGITASPSTSPRR